MKALAKFLEKYAGKLTGSEKELLKQLSGKQTEIENLLKTHNFLRKNAPSKFEGGYVSDMYMPQIHRNRDAFSDIANKMKSQYIERGPRDPTFGIDKGSRDAEMNDLIVKMLEDLHYSKKG